MEKFINKKKKQYKGYMIAFIVLLITTIIILLLCETGVLVPVFKNYNGIIFGMFLAFSINLFENALKLKKLLKNPDELKEKYVEENDERNLFISKEVSSLAFCIFSYALVASLVIFAFIDKYILNILGCVTLGLFIIAIIAGIICKKKY